MGMEPEDIPHSFIKQERKGFYGLYRASDGKLLAQSSNPRDLQAVAREAGYRQPGPDPQKYAASKILSEASHSAILQREALREQREILKREKKSVAKKGPSEHPGDKWLRDKDKATPTRGELNPTQRAIYDENISKAKATYQAFKAKARAGLGNRGGKPEGHERQPSNSPSNTGGRESRYIDEKSRRVAEAREAREAKLIMSKDHGLVVYKTKDNVAIKVNDIADAKKYAKANGLELVNVKEFVAKLPNDPPKAAARSEAKVTAKVEPKLSATEKAARAKEEAVANRTSAEATAIAMRNFPNAGEAAERGAQARSGAQASEAAKRAAADKKAQASKGAVAKKGR